MRSCRCSRRCRGTAAASVSRYIRNNTISGNTVLGYGPPDAAITTFDPDPAHFKIKSNKFGFAAGVQ